MQTDKKYKLDIKNNFVTEDKIHVKFYNGQSIKNTIMNAYSSDVTAPKYMK